MGFLTAQMAAQLLLHDKDENREKMLNWLSSGDDINWQRHWDLHKRRVPGTGKWLLESVQFQDWREGKGSPLLFCPGIRNSPETFADPISWRRKIFYGVCTYLTWLT